jgi:AcrR family transcriptional regulator
MCHNCVVSTAKRAYGGVSAADRRAQRRDALLDAAHEIVGTRGFAKLTVSGLCAEAGLNERYYYESFGDLEAVLTTLFDRIVGELGRAILEAVASAPDNADAKSKAAIGAAVDMLIDDPCTVRILFTEALIHPTLAARRSETMHTLASLVVAAGQQYYGPATALRVGDRAHFAAMHLVGGLHETITGWIDGTLPISRDELVDRSTELFVLVGGYLAGETYPAR